jgi:hypothetical protein
MGQAKRVFGDGILMLTHERELALSEVEGTLAPTSGMSFFLSTHPPFFEESFESATYEGFGFTNLLNQ